MKLRVWQDGHETTLLCSQVLVLDEKTETPLAIAVEHGPAVIVEAAVATRPQGFALLLGSMGLLPPLVEVSPVAPAPTTAWL